MDSVRVIESVRDLLSDEDKWCKNYAALNAQGIEVHAKHSGACKWCLTGAIVYATPDGTDPYYALKSLRTLAYSYTGSSGLTDFNDRQETTHKDLMGFLGKAIQDLK